MARVAEELSNTAPDASAIEASSRPSRFRGALERGEFVVTLEAVPAAGPGGRGIDTLLKDAEELAADGRIHAMSLCDNPGGGHAIMPDELAREIQSVGLDCIVHFTCKDLTRNGAVSRAYALERMGLRNILALTGDYPKEGYWGASKPAFDLDAVTLIKLLGDMNAGLVDIDRKGVPAPACDFFVGACVSPFKQTEAEQMMQYYKLHRKLNAGARFVISQLGYDMRKVQELKQYLDLHGIDVPVIGNVYVLNAGVARTMNANQVPGAVVPDSLLRFLESFPKGKEGRPRFLEHAAKMFAVVRGLGYRGVHLGGFGLKVEEAKEIIDRADEFQPDWQEHMRSMVYPIEPAERQFYYFQTDAATGLNAATPVDRKRLPNPDGGAHLHFRSMNALHEAVFQPGTRGFRAMQRAARIADGNRSAQRRRAVGREAVERGRRRLPGVRRLRASAPGLSMPGGRLPEGPAQRPLRRLLPRQVRGLPGPRLLLRSRLQLAEGGGSRGRAARHAGHHAELGAAAAVVMADLLPRARPHARRGA